MPNTDQHSIGQTSYLNHVDLIYVRRGSNLSGARSANASNTSAIYSWGRYGRQSNFLRKEYVSVLSEYSVARPFA
jgi:hypothetical protein